MNSADHIDIGGLVIFEKTELWVLLPFKRRILSFLVNRRCIVPFCIVSRDRVVKVNDSMYLISYSHESHSGRVHGDTILW